MGLREYRVDLHIHTSLSPCSDTWRMTPGAIVARAVEEGLDLIAVCDHNSMRNASAVQEAASGRGLGVLAGMEITSMEEVHVLGIFGDLGRARAVQEVVDRNLPGENAPEVFGHQVLMDAHDEIVGSEDRFLMGATLLALEQVVEAIHEHGGIAIASHVDREAFSVIGQLGWIPEALRLDGLEISWRASPGRMRERFPQIGGWTLIRGSDAHSPEEVGRGWSAVVMAEVGYEELVLALRGKEGRVVRVREG